MRKWSQRGKALRPSTAEFDEETVQREFARAGRRCECTRTGHDHTGRCPRTFTYGERKTRWQAHHRIAVSSGGGDAASNCQILCTICHPLVKPLT